MSAYQRVVVVVLLVEPVTPPVVSEPVVPEGELVLPGVALDPMLPDVEPLPLPLAPMELVLPLLLGVVPAVLPEPEPLVDGVVVLEELVEPVPPVEPVAASRLLQALSERAATTAKVAAAH